MIDSSQESNHLLVCDTHGIMITLEILKRLRLKTKEEEKNLFFDDKLLYLNDELIDFQVMILREYDEKLCSLQPMRVKSHIFLCHFMELFIKGGFERIWR